MHEPPLAVQTSIDKPWKRGEKPNIGTLNVPSFGIPEARKLETFNVSTFRPLGSEFERQNLNSFEFQLPAKIPTFVKVGISSISLGVAYYPPETENTINGFSASGGPGICSLIWVWCKRRSKNWQAFPLPCTPGEPLFFTRLLANLYLPVSRPRAC